MTTLAAQTNPATPKPAPVRPRRPAADSGLNVRLILVAMLMALALVAPPASAQTGPAEAPQPAVAPQPEEAPQPADDDQPVTAAQPATADQPPPVTAAEIAMQQWRKAWRDDAAINQIVFRDADRGFAVGDAGRLLTTVDGGANWQAVDHPMAEAWNLQSIAFGGADDVYVGGGRQVGPLLGSTGGLLYSSDGGRNWQRRLNTPRRIWQVLARGQYVLACAEPDLRLPSGLMHSDNAGATWSDVAGRLDSPVISATWVADLSAILASAGGQVLLYDPRLSPSLRPAGQLPGPATAMHVVSLHEWMAALQDGRIVFTSDGGQTWQEAAIDPPPLPGSIRAFSFAPGSSIGWAMAAGPQSTYFTRDGGRSWRAVGSFQAGPPRAIHFRDAWNGLLAGPFGTIYRTTDGGGTWQPVSGQETRPAMLIIAPYGEVDDLPLLSMLSGDRGFRTILWYATRPDDSGLPLLLAERRLRDALLPRWGAAGLILGPQITSRRDGRPMFSINQSLPSLPGFDGAEQFEATADLLNRAARAWRPAVVVTPDDASTDAEQQFVGAAATRALGRLQVHHWLRNAGSQPSGDEAPTDPDTAPAPAAETPSDPAAPSNTPAEPGTPGAADQSADQTTAANSPAADAQPEAPTGWSFMTIDPLLPSEVHGLHHALLVARNSSIFRQWPTAMPQTIRYGQRRPQQAQPDDAERPELRMLAQLRRADASTRRGGPGVAVAPLADRRIDHQSAHRLLTDFGLLLERGQIETALELVDDVARARAVLPDQQLQNVPRVYDLGRYLAWQVGRQAALAGRDDLALQALAIIEPQRLPDWQDINANSTTVDVNQLAEGLLWRMEALASAEIARLGLPAEAGRTIDTRAAAEQMARLQAGFSALIGRPPQAHAALLRLKLETDQAVRAQLLGDLQNTVDHLPPDLAWPARLHLWLASDRSQPSPMPMVHLERNQENGLIQQSATVGPETEVTVIEQADALNVLIDRQLAASTWLMIDLDADASTLLVEPFAANQQPQADSRPQPQADDQPRSQADQPNQQAQPQPSAELAVMAPVWLRRADLFSREAMGRQIALRLPYQALGGRPPRGTIWILSLRRQAAPLLRPQTWPGDGSNGFFALVFE